MKTKFKQTEIGKIPEDWEVKKLGETLLQIIDGDRGVNYPKQNEFYKKGYCLFLNTKNVRTDKIIEVRSIIQKAFWSPCKGRLTFIP